MPRGAHVVWAADRRRAPGAADETTVVESIVYLILVGLILGWQNGLDVNYIKLISLTSFVSPGVNMSVVTVRNLPEETHRALRVRAAQHGRSTEAEIRAILEEAVRPEGRLKIGSALADFGKRHGGLDLDVTRDESSPRAASFE